MCFIVPFCVLLRIFRIIFRDFLDSGSQRELTQLHSDFTHTTLRRSLHANATLSSMATQRLDDNLEPISDSEEGAPETPVRK